jgi:hypothetical protein
MRRASVADTVRVGLSVLAPIAAQGVILRRPRMVALRASTLVTRLARE